MKKYLISILGLLVIIGVSVGVYFIIGNKNPFNNTNAGQVSAPDTRCANIANADDKKTCEQGSYDSWLEQIKNKAFTEKNQEFCQIIPDEIDRDVCYQELVYYLPQADVCAKISDTVRQIGCNNTLISKSGDINDCGKIAAEAERRYCLETYLMQETNAGETMCPKLNNVLAEVCWELYYTRRGLGSLDYDWCKKIKTAEGQKNCLAKMPTDTDGDGLDDYSEISRYKTNPNKADTDGDSYSDGVEVKAGYDPLKP